MESDRCEDSGEMYSPDEQDESVLLNGAPRFSVQGLSDALADVGEGITEPPAEEYAMMLEVMMADRPGWLTGRPSGLSRRSGSTLHLQLLTLFLLVSGPLTAVTVEHLLPT